MAESRVTQLPYATHPQVGESFSSWLMRLAESYGETPSGMVGDALRESGVAKPKPDFASWADQPSIEIVEALSRRTGVSAEVLAATTLDGRDKSLNLPLNRPDTCNLFSGQNHAYCPDCLAEDGYWRLWWSSTTFIACPKHGTRLANRCPSCNSSPKKIMGLSTHTEVTNCGQCGHSLIEPSTEESDVASLPLLEWSNILQSANGRTVETRSGILLVDDFVAAVCIVQEVCLPSVFARTDYERWAWCYLQDDDELNKMGRLLAGAPGDLIGYGTLASEPLAHLLGWLFSDWQVNLELLYACLDPGRKKLLLRRRARLSKMLRAPLAGRREPKHTKPGVLAA